jgi:5'(3')-deoxyribonucleotidase
MKFKVTVDTDGVLRDFVSKTIEIIEKECKIKIIQPITSYHLEKFLGLTEEEFDYFVYGKHANEIFTTAKPYEGALEFLHKLEKEGFEIILSSSQPNIEIYKYTLDWYIKNNFYFKNIMFTKNKYNIFTDFLIEDSPKQIMKALISTAHSDNHKSIIGFGQTWNSNIRKEIFDANILMENFFYAYGENTIEQFNNAFIFIINKRKESEQIIETFGYECFEDIIEDEYNKGEKWQIK